jgi:hypothetical protein
LHLSSGNLKNSPLSFHRPQKRSEAAHQHTSSATLILMDMVWKGEKNQKRISSGSSPYTNFEPGKKRVRIIYRISKSGVIDIVAIGPRRMIYEENFRLVKRQIGE